MASDTRTVTDTDSGRPHPSFTGYMDASVEDASKFVHPVWRRDFPVGLSQVMGSDFTDLGQNGTTLVRNTDVSNEYNHPLPPSPIRVPEIPVHRERFRLLATWIGRVQRINEDSFVAVIEDQLASRPDEEAELFVSEVAPVDIPLLVPGAVFYWSIGYRDRLGGQRTRESIIRFRRLPKPSPADIADAQEWARSIQLASDNG